MGDGGQAGEGRERAFKAMLELAMHQAGLSTRSLHDNLLRELRCDIPENTIDSWRRAHSTTGAPSFPREQTVEVLAHWLCARSEVKVTEEEILGAWRADRSTQASRPCGGCWTPSGLEAADVQAPAGRRVAGQ